MAQTFITDAGALVIPGAYATFRVQQANSGLATSGVLMLVGESDMGPDYTKESSLQDNAFGPDQAAAVRAKYGSGPLVDAFNAAVQASNDPNITGAPTSLILVKTNPGAKASANLLKFSGATWSALADKSYGKPGNLINYTVAAKTSEVLPTTGAFTFIPPAGTVNATGRVNGGSGLAIAVAAGATPSTFVSTVNALSGIAATGGAARTVIPGVSGNIALAIVSGNAITITYTGTWTTTPSVGDTLVIPEGSAIADNGGGPANENVGAYVVTAATSNSISCTKLSDAGKTSPSPVPGTITAPVAVGSTAVLATSDFTVYSPVTITLEAGDPVDGVGKTLSLAELTSGTDRLSRTAFVLGTTTPVTWISKSGAAANLASSSEYRALLSVNRQSTNTSEDIEAGGEVVLRVSYQGTTATLTISDTALSTTVTGGSGGNLDLNLADFPTVADLVQYLNAQTGYRASAGTAVLGQLPAWALDDGTYTICSDFGELNGRIKADAYRFYNAVVEQSATVQLGAGATPSRPAAGLPAPTTLRFLSGGTRGATTDAVFSSAIDALEKVRGNFVVPLFSRDASLDVLDGLTDSSSTYTIDAIHAKSRSHVLAMSKLKQRRNRQAFLSYKGTFNDAKEKAANMAQARCSMSFLDQKVVGSEGSVLQLQPWADAALAAGMQAAGFYRAIVHKVKNVAGSLQAAGDWSDLDGSQVEAALLAGLLPTKRDEAGAYRFVSDQTTYGANSNFVWNSIQAVYVADTIALTTAQRMEDAFVGQSLADVSAAVALSFLEGIMADFLRLKLIAPSDDAPLGFKNAKVTITGGAMLVDCEVKLAGAIYFIPITFLISQVTQTAAQ